MTSNPATLAAQLVELRETAAAITEEADAIREQLKGILLGEATAPPEGGWVYGPITVQYVKASERPSLNRKKLVLQGVTLEQLVAATDYTKMPPTIRVVKTGEGE